MVQLTLLENASIALFCASVTEIFCNESIRNFVVECTSTIFDNLNHFVKEFKEEKREYLKIKKFGKPLEESFYDTDDGECEEPKKKPPKKYKYKRIRKDKIGKNRNNFVESIHLNFEMDKDPKNSMNKVYMNNGVKEYYLYPEKAKYMNARKMAFNYNNEKMAENKNEENSINSINSSDLLDGPLTSNRFNNGGDDDNYWWTNPNHAITRQNYKGVNKFVLDKSGKWKRKSENIQLLESIIEEEPESYNPFIEDEE